MKRFTETSKWSDPWFQSLPCKFKAFWAYILDNCDAAGVWKVNFPLAEFQITERFDPKEVLAMFDGRIENLGNGKWWIVKFCQYQYGKLSASCRPHIAIMGILKLHGLLERVQEASNPPPAKGYPYPMDTLQEKDTDRDKDKEREKEQEGGVGDAQPPAKAPPEVTPPPAGDAPPPVKPPHAFPASESLAVAAAMSAGIPEDFIIDTWNKALGRGGCDSRDIPIRNWVGHLKTEWKYECQRRARANGQSHRQEKAGREWTETLHIPVL